MNKQMYVYNYSMLIKNDKEKMCYTHSVDYYSAVKRKENLIHATTWMNFEDIKVS
jgi:sRNA-binding regulator protein Hfq